MCRIAAKSSIEKNIRKMRRFARIDTSQFFKLTGMHLRFDGISATKDIESVDKQLDAAERNYFLQGPAFDVERLKGLFEKVRKFNINTDPEFIKERIKKLGKIEPFYKEHVEALAPPISLILKFIKIILRFWATSSSFLTSFSSFVMSS